jgi:hypothetical protein
MTQMNNDNFVLLCVSQRIMDYLLTESNLKSLEFEVRFEREPTDDIKDDMKDFVKELIDNLLFEDWLITFGYYLGGIITIKFDYMC